MITTWIALILYRERAIGTSNVPADGPAIVAPNHFSNMDHFFAGVYMRRKMQFMAKSQLFGNPILNYIFRIGGVFPVRRGHHDEEAFKTAHAVFDRGGCVLMYCRGRPLAQRRPRRAEAGRRPPRARVGRAGRPGRDPRLRRRPPWRKLRFPKVTVQYGEPITFPVVAEPDPRAAAGGGREESSRSVARCTRRSTTRAAAACQARLARARRGEGGAGGGRARSSPAGQAR